MRFLANLDADYWSGGTATPAGRAHICDVSREGARLSLGEALQPGTPVRLSLRVPGDSVPVPAVGEVAWAAPGSPEGWAGVRFRQIKPLDLARMLDYLYAQWLGA